MNTSQTYLPIVIAPYNGKSDKKLVNLLDAFFAGMDGNEDLTSLADDVAAFGIAKTAFSNQVTLARNTRDKSTIAAKNAMRDNIIPQATALGVAVQQVAGTNLEILLGSCAPQRKAPQSVVLQTPSVFDVLPGTKAGQLIVKTSAVYGARVYNIKYAPDPLGETPVWQSVSNSTSQCVLTGLQSGLRYWVLVEIVGSKKQAVETKMQLSLLVQ